MIFPEQALGVGVGVFKRGIQGREGGPPAAGIPTPPSSLSWSRRGRPQTGNHKSPPARPGCRNAVVCGGRAETGSLVFVNKNGERPGRRPPPPVLPAVLASHLLGWGAWDTTVGGGVRHLWLVWASLTVEALGFRAWVMLGSQHRGQGWSRDGARCPAAPAGWVTSAAQYTNSFQRSQACQDLGTSQLH